MGKDKAKSRTIAKAVMEIGIELIRGIKMGRGTKKAIEIKATP